MRREHEGEGEGSGIRAELPTSHILAEIEAAHGRRELAQQLGVPHDCILNLRISPPTETVTDGPTLVELRTTAAEQQRVAEERLEHLASRKSEGKWHWRTHQSIMGALTYLQASGALALVGISVDEVGAEAEGDTAQTARWLASIAPRFDVSDMAHVAREAEAEVADKEQRRATRQELLTLQGKLFALSRLQESELGRETRIAPGRKGGQVDLRWNVGLPPTGGVQVCYYCAGLVPPIGASHRMAECPKRRKANEREYTAVAMEATVGELAARRAAAEANANLYSHAGGSRAEAKLELISLTAAAKLLEEGESVDEGAGGVGTGTPQPAPEGARSSAWLAHARRRHHDASMVLAMIARAARQEPGAWAEVKAVSLMAPHGRILAAHLDAAWLTEVARSIDLDISVKGADHHLLPVVIEYARAPLPAYWSIHQPSESAGASAEDSGSAGATAYRHVHEISGTVVDGHPLASAMLPHIKGMIARARRGLRPKPSDSWLQMSDGGGGSFFLDLKTGERSDTFPFGVPGIAPCVLPARTLEPAAERLAAAAEALWAATADDTVVAEVRRQLWQPKRAARSLHLSHSPCPLDTAVLMGQYIGVCAAKRPDLMWLVDLALTPELPVGWVRVEGSSGAEHFVHAACGLSQWEHPQTAFLTGIARRLCRAPLAVVSNATDEPGVAFEQAGKAASAPALADVEAPPGVATAPSAAEAVMASPAATEEVAAKAVAAEAAAESPAAAEAVAAEAVAAEAVTASPAAESVAESPAAAQAVAAEAVAAEAVAAEVGAAGPAEVEMAGAEAGEMMVTTSVEAEAESMLADTEPAHGDEPAAVVAPLIDSSEESSAPLTEPDVAAAEEPVATAPDDA